MKDYYSILGVGSGVTAEEIKKEYRRKAKMYHPDACKLPDAQQRFVEISEAYEILSNEIARREYDRLYFRSNEQAKTTTGSTQNTYSTPQPDFDDIFAAFQQQARATAQKYADISLEDLLSKLGEVVYETAKFIATGEEHEKLSVGEFITLGFAGVFLIIGICLLFTGVGTIPGIVIARIAAMSLFKGGRFSGEFIGVAPLILSTLVVGGSLIVILMMMVNSLFA